MSITSMAARAGMAQKLSIPQLQQAIQDGTVPAYVGVPLLQDKVKQQKEAMAMAAQQSQMPSIAQQVMNEATQVEQGVNMLNSNLPTTGMAGGGIVAFADGGMYDDEDETDEDRQDAERMAAMEEAMDEYQQSLSTATAPTSEGSDSYRAVRVSPSGGEFEALALEKNKKHGVDEHLLKHVMHKETGGMKDRAHAVSPAGAEGVMQLMPATAKALGVKDAFDPEQNIEGGVKYLAQLERKYKDPKLAAMAYNWGPGNVDKWLMAGADMSKLPKETRGYVQGLAQGGEVKHFEAGGFNPYTGEFEYDDDIKREGLGDKFLRAINYKKGLTAGENMPGMAKAKELVAGKLAARNNQDQAATSPLSAADEKMFSDATNRYMADRASQQAAPAPDQGPAPTQNPAAQGPAAAPAAAPATPDEFASFKEMLNKRYENLGKQREEDKAMAIMMAGLGMMGGTSPYAAANIGQGAAQGLQSLAQAKAQRTAEENALMSGQLGLYKIGAGKSYQDQMLQLRKELANQTNARLTQAGQEAQATKDERLALATQTNLDNAIAKRYEALSRNGKLAAESIFDPTKKKAFLDDMEAKINKDKLYRNLYKQRWGYAPDEGFEESAGSDAGTPSKIQSILDKYK